MAKFIKEVHDTVNFYAGKNVASKLNPSQLDMAVYDVITEIFEELLDEYPKTRRINRLLSPFKEVETVVISSGIGSIPSDFYLERPSYVTNTDTLIDFVDDDRWARAIKDPIKVVSESKPIAKIDAVDGEADKKLIVRPNTLSSVDLYYFRLPVAPVYAFTTSGTKYVYDDNNSIDIELGRGVRETLITRVLSRYGINIRDNELIQYSEIQKQQSKVDK